MNLTHCTDHFPSWMDWGQADLRGTVYAGWWAVLDLNQ